MSAQSYWQPWQPKEAEAWSIERVVHLHRRSGFLATWPELQRDLKGEPQDAVTRVLNGSSRIGGTPADFEQMSEVIGASASASSDPARLKAWWIYRCLFSPNPLGERLTLMWHNHFATSNAKVANLGQMKRQNELFRELAQKPFGELLRAVVKDPAMLVWLDADENRKQRPNENLAREIMELFTLGVGNYSESDVKEAARALTGWSVEEGRFKFNEQQHDGGEKSILGQTGDFDGDDLIELLLNSPAVAERIANRLASEFFGEGGIAPEAISELADGLRRNELSIGWGVETILRSQLFFSDGQLRNRVVGPVEYVVGLVRTLEQSSPPPSTLKLAEWVSRLGQDMFYPPNVFGWPGGRAWMTSRALIGRANFAIALVNQRLHSSRTSIDPLLLPSDHEMDGAEAVAFYLSILGVRERSQETSNAVSSLKDGFTDSERNEAQLRADLASIISSPEAMLG